MTLLPSWDEIPKDEPKSPSLLSFSTLTCLALCRIKHNLLWYRRGQSCTYISLSVSPLARISLICTILFEFFDDADHSIGRYISSPHLIQTKSPVMTSSLLFKQNIHKIKWVKSILSVGISYSKCLIYTSIKSSPTFPTLDLTIFTIPPFLAVLSLFSNHHFLHCLMGSLTSLQYNALRSRQRERSTSYHADTIIMQ